MIVFQRRTTRILDKKNGRKSLSSNLSHFLRLNGACLRCLLSKFRNFKVSSSTVGWIYWNALERDHGFVWESIFLKKLIFRSRRSAYPLSAAGKQKLNRPGGIKVGFCRDTWSIARMIERSTRILNAGDSWDAAREREREREKERERERVRRVLREIFLSPCGIPVMRAGEDIVIDDTQRYLLYDLPYIMEKRREMWNEENHVER